MLKILLKQGWHKNRNHTILPLIPTVVWCQCLAIQIISLWHHTTVGIRGSIVRLRFYVSLVSVVFLA